MGLRKSKIKAECAECGWLQDEGQKMKCYTHGCPAFESDNEDEAVSFKEIHNGDLPDDFDEGLEEDSDLLCICGNMKFIVRTTDNGTIAICPDCGEQMDID